MNSDYDRIERAINYLRDNANQQPGLSEAARACGLSPYHFQRMFRRWAGVSPKQFLKFLTVKRARALLAASRPALDTCFEVGLSGPSRLYDHFVTVEAVTPGEAKSQGAGLEIICGEFPSQFGRAFAGITERGICRLEFIGREDSRLALDRLTADWPKACIKTDNNVVTRKIGRLVEDNERRSGFKLLVKGTNFQIQVWQALLRIPEGHVCAYSQLAAYIGKPASTRAVASAIGANHIAYLIPCHRVLRAGGELGGYRWGLGRKQAMLLKEFSNSAVNSRDPHSSLALPA